MTTLLAILSFILGAIVGSFLLVVSLRFNTGKSLQGRSQCFSCRKTLKWYELVPIVSYLMQQGRCRTCSSHIASETLFAELTTAVVFVVIALRSLFVGDSLVMWTMPYLFATIFLFILFATLLVIFHYDLRHKIIPDKLSLSFAVLALIGSFFFGVSQEVFIYQGFHIPDLWHLLGGIIVPLPFVLIWLFSEGRMMGLGDPKLMVGMGFLFGTLQGLSAVFVSFWIGTLYIISVILIERILKKKLFSTTKGGIMNQEVPFGPFLIIGTLVTLVWNITLL